MIDAVAAGVHPSRPAPQRTPRRAGLPAGDAGSRRPAEPARAAQLCGAATYAPDRHARAPPTRTRAHRPDTPRPHLAARAERARDARAGHPVGAVGDDGRPRAIWRWCPIRTTGSTAPARVRSASPNRSALAQAVREVVAEDRRRRDTSGRSSPSSTCPARPTAASRRWPGLHQAMAAAVDAYHAARDGRAPHRRDRRRHGAVRRIPHPRPAGQPDPGPRRSRAWRSMPCTRPPPPASPCAPSTNSTSSAKTIVPMSYDVAGLGQARLLRRSADGRERRRPNAARRRDGQRGHRRRRRAGPPRPARSVQPARLRRGRDHPSRLARGP